jgi:AcrR family transcriptional regulator
MDDGRAAPAGTARYAKKREAIIEAAAGAINRQGVKGMTLADVAASVGLITTSVTYYFKRKEDLAAACFLSAIARLDELIDAALNEATPPARLARFIDLCLDLDRRIRLGEAPPIAMFGDTRALGEPHRSTVGEAYASLFRKVRSLFYAEGAERLSRKATTARTVMLVEQVLWSATWLPRYEVEDYRRDGRGRRCPWARSCRRRATPRPARARPSCWPPRG